MLVFLKRKLFLSVRVFGLLSSSLLYFSQHFGRCILRPSSGVPCLSGHRNDSTWEIIFKVLRLYHFYAQINSGHMRKAGGYSGRNIVKNTIKTKTKVRKLLLIKIIKLRLRNLDKKIICFVDFIYIELFTEIFYILYSIFEYFLDLIGIFPCSRFTGLNNIL